MNIDIKFNRRKYGQTTFTWVMIFDPDRINNHWIQLGDPWPVKNPPKNEVLLAVSEAVLRYNITPGSIRPGGKGIQTVQIPED